jgi:hypothetical protein
MVGQPEPTVDELFADAQYLMDLAVRELNAGDIRQAAEKAWGATVAGTDGLLLARLGEKPPTTGLTRLRLEEEADKDSSLESIRLRFFTREQTLHGRCFYEGICEPKETIERRIRETAGFIQDAHRMASV